MDWFLYENGLRHKRVNLKLTLTSYCFIFSFLTLFRMGAKRPPTSFSFVTSTNVGISPKNFLTFGFKPFATLV